MRHRVAGRKLGRTTEHRIALLRNLSTALFDKEKITTTLAKAKELRPFAEKLVTLSKRESLHARRQVMRHIHNRGVVAKLFESISARYAQRPGGYTRIIKLGPRRGDHAEMAIIELVGAEAEAGGAAEGRKGKKSKKAKTAGKKSVSGAKKAKTADKKPASGAKKAKTRRKKTARAEADSDAAGSEKPKRTRRKKVSRSAKGADAETVERPKAKRKTKKKTSSRAKAKVKD